MAFISPLPPLRSGMLHVSQRWRAFSVGSPSVSRGRGTDVSRHNFGISSLRACDESTPLYIDDPFGGFKGVRKTKATDEWASCGTYVTVHESGKNPPVRVFVYQASVPTASSTSALTADVLILPGFPSPSFLSRNTCNALAAARPGSRVLALDWPGIGQSDAPQHGLGGFEYGLPSFVSAARAVIAARALGRGDTPLVVVGHGFVGAAAAASVAAMEDGGVWGAVFLAPAVGRDAQQLPREVRKLRNPLVGPLLCSNPAHMADKIFSSASPYEIVEEDMQVLRTPFMQSGGPGFAAKAIADNFDWKEVEAVTRDTIAALQCPMAFATGAGDKWLRVRNLSAELHALEERIKENGNDQVSRTDWKYSGHFIFDDAPEDCAKLVDSFITKVLEVRRS